MNPKPCGGKARSSKIGITRTETVLHSIVNGVSEISAIAGIRLMVGGEGIKLSRDINSGFNNVGYSLKARKTGIHEIKGSGTSR